MPPPKKKPHKNNNNKNTKKHPNPPPLQKNPKQTKKKNQYTKKKPKHFFLSTFKVQPIYVYCIVPISMFLFVNHGNKLLCFKNENWLLD